VVRRRQRPDNGGRRWVLAQTLGIVLVWLIPAALHAGNDGLWFLGDAARHALNGLFWWDFLSTLPLDPRAYVLRYYARYPAIAPLSYPPVFYLLEGTAFRMFGASPFVAKSLVLCFSLLACLYTAAWLRRYVAFDAGWGGALLALQPGVVIWSNAVMLNVPSMAFGMAALYHTRRWLEEPGRRQLLAALVFGALVTLTYFPAAVVPLVMGAWLLSEAGWRVLWREHRPLVLLALSSLGALSLAIVHWVPLPLDLALPDLESLRDPARWLAYIWGLPKILNASIIFLAALAVPAAILERRWRLDVRLLVIWILLTYAGLSYLWSQDPRYALLLAPAFVIMATIGLRALVEAASVLLGAAASPCFRGTLFGLLAVNACVAWVVPVPRIDGFRELASFVVRNAPTERTFFEGSCDGVFTFYVRAQDPAFRRAVVRGSKLLYASAIFQTWRLTERVSSASQVVEALEKECGCGWVAIEAPGGENEIGAVRSLREALRGPEFRLLRSFPVRAPSATHVDLYQFLGPLKIPEEIELPFPILEGDPHLRARPIER
jgi:hypothetical protein